MLRTFHYIFFVIVLLDILALYYSPNVRLVTKPLIMASLMAWYILSVKRQDNLLMTGMIFAMIGDILLEFEFQESFIMGLCSFLLMQVCYALVFKRNFAKPTLWKWGVIAVVFLIASGFIVSYWPNFQALNIYVAIYTMAIAIMVSMAISRKTTYMLQQSLVIGVLLFMFSDMVLAINMFVEKVPHSGLFIMASYSAAQLLIVSSMIQESKQVPSKRTASKP